MTSRHPKSVTAQGWFDSGCAILTDTTLLTVVRQAEMVRRREQRSNFHWSALWHGTGTGEAVVQKPLTIIEQFLTLHVHVPVPQKKLSWSIGSKNSLGGAANFRIFFGLISNVQVALTGSSRTFTSIIHNPNSFRKACQFCKDTMIFVQPSWLACPCCTVVNDLSISHNVT